MIFIFKGIFIFFEESGARFSIDYSYLAVGSYTLISHSLETKGPGTKRQCSEISMTALRECLLISLSVKCNRSIYFVGALKGGNERVPVKEHYCLTW